MTLAPQFVLASIASLLLAADNAPRQFGHARTSASDIATSKIGDASPVWVFFREARTAPCDACDTAITDLAIERRAHRRTLPGLVDVRDVPVPTEFTDAVAATGATIRVTSRWLNAVSAMATPAQVAALKQLPGVLRVEGVRRGRSIGQDECDSLTAAPEFQRFGSDFYGNAATQTDQIDLRNLHNAGYRGAGIVIGVLDCGFNRVHEAFHSAEHPLQVIAEWDFVKNDGNTGIEAGDYSEQHKHGTWILGTMAAYMPNQLVGTAYEAKFVLAKTEKVDTETSIEEDWYVGGLEFVEAHGADLATSSLGYIDWYSQDDMDGHTAVTTIAVNQATANGLICLTAAGNEGHDADPATNTLIAPADALQVISCGAVYDTGAIAEFSSSGPTFDGRVKPEILAMGVQTATINSTAATGFSAVSGTSLSTPVLAGAVACMLQARPDFTVDSIRQALFATATQSDEFGLHPDPLFVTGYGIAQAYKASQYAPPCPSDLDGSGEVDGGDIGLVLLDFGPCPGCSTDLDGSGEVDGGDIGLVLLSFGPCNS
ncbi:MAG: S8 family serine peptidase [Planctomycetes bacterium]|nr:S8 family serine peptidase [Planctomycetota bacterium]